MTNERVSEADYPSVLEHKHGLSEWVPMLPDRDATTPAATSSNAIRLRIGGTILSLSVDSPGAGTFNKRIT